MWIRVLGGYYSDEELGDESLRRIEVQEERRSKFGVCFKSQLLNLWRHPTGVNLGAKLDNPRLSDWA